MLIIQTLKHMDATYYFYFNSVVFIFFLIIFLLLTGRGFMNNNLYLVFILILILLFNVVMFLLTYKPSVYENIIGYLSIPVFISFSRANSGLCSPFKKLYPHYFPAILLFLLYIIFWLTDISFRSKIWSNKTGLQSSFFNMLDIIFYIYFLSAIVYCLDLLYSSNKKNNPRYSPDFLKTKRQYGLSVMWIFLIFGSITVPLGLIGFGEPYQKYIVFFVSLAVFINVVYNSL